VDYLQICPTGWSLLQRFQPTIDNYFPVEPLLDLEQGPPKAPPIFSIVSTNFSEEEYHNIESFLEETGHKLKKATMIFRASEHNFRSKVFK